MEINEDCPHENKQRLFSQSSLYQGNWPPSLMMAETQAQAEECGSFIVKREREGSGMLWSEFVDLGKLEAGLLEVGHLMSLVWRAYLAFFGWSWVGVGAEVKDASRCWASPDHFWPAAAGVVVRFPKLVGKSELCQVVSHNSRLWVRVLFLYMFWPVSISIFSLSTSELLEENIGENIYLEFSKHFLKLTLNAQYIKEKNWYIGL